MSTSKHFDKIAWTVMALMLAFTILFMNGAALGIEVMAHTMGYENRLFDNSRVHTIDIVMNDWDEFIENATSEEYYVANVVIDGEAYKNVGIRGKGNTSLSTVSSLGSERYSFKIEFDQYDSSVTYHGLDKLSLNNLIQDSTMMKDYLTYTMMNEFGVAAPLCSFVYITVNGEDWGLYLAVEGVEDAFLERNYGSDYGELYKPDSMSFGGGRGNGKDFDMDDFMNREESADGSEESATMPDKGSFDPSSMFGENFDPSSIFGGEMPNMGDFDFSKIPNMQPNDSENGEDSSSGGGKGDFDFSNIGGMGGFGMGSSDVKLQYIDDSLDSYSNIWNNAKTDITENDQLRLIESLEKLSNGEEIESVVDIEQVIRYFVVHNYVCNGDSYTGSMIHNYYLYEENGQMSMIPWDYNLAYGTFQGGNGQSTVNTPIDAPVSGGSGEDRPMWSWILSDESYTEMYHQYYTEFLNTVDIQGIIDDAYELIKSYVAKDPTAFYTYEEFELGVETMREFCALRSESISMQLENGETVNNMSYADASDLTLSDMGSMSGMGGFGGGGMPDMGDKGGFGGRGSSDRETSGKNDSDQSGFQTMPQTGEGNSLSVQEIVAADTSVISLSSMMPEGFDLSRLPSGFGNIGELPEGLDPSQMPNGFANMGELPEGFDPSQIPGGIGGNISGQPSETAQSDDSGNTETSANNNRPSGGNMQIPGNSSWGSDINGTGASAQNREGWTWIAVSVLILGVGLIIAQKYKY